MKVATEHLGRVGKKIQKTNYDAASKFELISQRSNFVFF